MASAISGFINAIRNAVYGEEVRGAIISALEQCYSDVNAPSLQTEAFEAALNEAYAGGILDIQTVTTIAAMTNDKIIYRYNGTETGKQKGLYYYSALASGWVLIGSEIQNVTNVNQMTDQNSLYRYTGTAAGMVNNAIYTYNGTSWNPIGSGLLTASTAAQMTNEGAIYKYTGTESGYQTNALYYYNGTAWVTIASNVETTSDFTQTGAGKPADAYAVGMAINGIEGISTEVKEALLDCFNNVAWANTLGNSLYNALRSALYPETPIDIGYITTGLFALWDGINNTGRGHDGSAENWVDLVAGKTFSPYSTSKTFAFGESGLVFSSTASGSTTANANVLVCPNFGVPTTIEVVFTPSSFSASMVPAILTGELTDVDGMRYIAMVKGTNTLIVHKGAGGCFDLPSSYADIKSVSVVYGTTIKAYINGQPATANNNQEYFSNGVGYTNIAIGGTPSWSFKGTIHSIRMYSTALTDEDIADNYAIDEERFNLGT